MDSFSVREGDFSMCASVANEDRRGTRGNMNKYNIHVARRFSPRIFKGHGEPERFLVLNDDQPLRANLKGAVGRWAGRRKGLWVRG